MPYSARRPYAKTALLLANPHARQVHQQLSTALEQLQTLGFEIIEECPDHPKSFASLIRHYQHQVDLVIVGGGDGTLNAAVDGLVETKLPLGILPLGTANDLARTLEIPASVSEACQVIAAGHLQPIDLGWVNGKHFFNVASLGLSVNIAQKLTKEVKRRWGVFAYAIAAIQAIQNARPFSAEIHDNEKSKRVKTLQIAVGNGRYYGGGMAIAHDATINDQRLDLYSLEIKHWWQIFMVWWMLWSGRHRKEFGSRPLSGSEFKVYTRKPQPINTDGEITTTTPAHFRVVPQAIRVYVPKPTSSF